MDRRNVSDNEVRLKVVKTYKLFIGGKFQRAESGVSYELRDANGRFLGHAGSASRKDVRDAVAAARAAQPKWAAATAYNRGQILYRIAEMLENRADEYVLELRQSSGATTAAARREVQASVDRLVYYAGWSDKFGAVLSSVNPVSAKMHNFTVPEPVGVVGIACPAESPLLSLISLVAPTIVSGNTVVVALDEDNPKPGLAFAEVLAVSDLPAGVVNLLSGSRSQMLPTLASHRDVDAIDLVGVGAEFRVEMERLAADSVKRVAERNDDWRQEGLAGITPFLEFKTTWHALGW